MAGTQTDYEGKGGDEAGDETEKPKARRGRNGRPVQVAVAHVADTG